MLGLLRKYPQYTLSTLLAEDAELLRLETIVSLGGDV